MAAPVLTPAAHGGACGDAWNALIHDPERIARATPAEVLPLFQGMMKGGCKACPSAQTRVCQNLEKPLSYLGHDIVAPWMPCPGSSRRTTSSPAASRTTASASRTSSA
ncbi:MAG TPA: hypothetical protein PKA49_11210 [Tepidiformaceae bacterium]|nr:hypothetical protein [Tepidiformaceae bacterium]